MNKFEIFDRNYDFALFPEIGNFSGLTGAGTINQNIINIHHHHNCIHINVIHD